jgi:hypothetical protein
MAPPGATRPDNRMTKTGCRCHFIASGGLEAFAVACPPYFRTSANRGSRIQPLHTGVTRRLE